MFQLTMNEVSYCSRCQNDTLNVGNSSSSRSQFVTLNVQRGQNIKYLPYAFTEQGIYMLMTVLRGELAVKQSRTLIRLFKSMKDYYLEGGSLISKIVDNSNDIAKIKFICTNKTIHDRFIILDEKIFYLVGSSSKDIGKKMTTILEITDTNIHQILIKSIKKLEEKF